MASDWAVTGVTLTTILIWVLFAAWLLFMIKMYIDASDFPHRRKYCKSKTKLNGKTAIVTGKSVLKGRILHFESGSKGKIITSAN